MKNAPVRITCQAFGQTQEAVWRSISQPAPQQMVEADDTLSADGAMAHIKSGKSLLWTGDFHNARQLMTALARRQERASNKRRRGASPRPSAQAILSTNASEAPDHSAARAFQTHRAAQARRAGLLSKVLVFCDADRTIPLRRAPDARVALNEAWGEPDGQPSIVPLSELQGMVGAHEWRVKGVEIGFLKARIHPHYGVFSPLRGEYIDLISTAPIPEAGQALAFDIGTGSGVVSAVLVSRGVARVIATDIEPRAVACAQDNLTRLGLASQVEVQCADLFPAGEAGLIVCNPPWLPAPANTPIEHAVYDPDSAMLKGFLAGLRQHLAPQGEGWLVLSDLAEHLGLRTRAQLLGWIEEAGLRVLGKLDTQPTHTKAANRADPLFEARSQEVTSLWRLAADES